MDQTISDRIEVYVQRVQNLSTFGAAFLYDVFKLVESLGITMTDGDCWLLGFSVQQIEQEIKNSCNVSSVPFGLFKAASGLIVARFLSAKRAKDGMSAEMSALNFSPVLKELSEGDTKLVYAVDSTTSPEQRLDQFLGLLESGRNQFVTYRRIRW